MKASYKTSERQREAARKYNEALSYRRASVTPEQYGAMLAEQSGTCAICNEPPKKNRLAVDHNHLTGRVRGLLCIRCNITLGNLEKRKDSYLNYLEKWR